MHWLLAAGAGVIGALAMTMLTEMSRALGLIEANLTRYQGCIVTHRLEGGTVLLAGLMSHLMMGAVLALGYAVILHIISEAAWWGGAIIGFVHSIAAGFGFPMLDRINPCVADGRIRAFGMMGRNYGVMMMLGLLMGHVIYGAIVGAIYTLPGR